jgi:hypothetical protein
LSQSSASPPAIFESPNNVSITAATSAAAAAITDAATLADSQKTTVPRTELSSLPTITNSSHNSSPSETSKLDHDIINENNNDNNDDVSDDKNDDDDDMSSFFGNHNGDGDYTASQFSVQQRVIHFLGERIDRQKNRLNVEICLLIEASTAVSNERSTTAEIRSQMMLNTNRNLVCMFPQDDFVSPSIQDDMCIMLFNGKSKHGYTCDKLWRKFEDWRKKIRAEYMTKLPKGIADYPSSHSLRDVYKKFVVECYKVEHSVSYIAISMQVVLHHPV